MTAGRRAVTAVFVDRLAVVRCSQSCFHHPQTAIESFERGRCGAQVQLFSMSFPHRVRPSEEREALRRENRLTVLVR